VKTGQGCLPTQALGLKLKDQQNLSYKANQVTLVLHSTNFLSLHFTGFYTRLKNCLKELKKTLSKLPMDFLTATSAAGAVTPSTEAVTSSTIRDVFDVLRANNLTEAISSTHSRQNGHVAVKHFKKIKQYYSGLVFSLPLSHSVSNKTDANVPTSNSLSCFQYFYKLAFLLLK